MKLLFPFISPIVSLSHSFGRFRSARCHGIEYQLYSSLGNVFLHHFSSSGSITFRSESRCCAFVRQRRADTRDECDQIVASTLIYAFHNGIDTRLSPNTVQSSDNHRIASAKHFICGRKSADRNSSSTLSVRLGTNRNKSTALHHSSRSNYPTIGRETRQFTADIIETDDTIIVRRRSTAQCCVSRCVIDSSAPSRPHHYLMI